MGVSNKSNINSIDKIGVSNNTKLTGINHNANRPLPNL